MIPQTTVRPILPVCLSRRPGTFPGSPPGPLSMTLSATLLVALLMAPLIALLTALLSGCAAKPPTCEQLAARVTPDPTTAAEIGTNLAYSRCQIEEHPDRIYPRTYRARALLIAGLVEEARDEARRAVELAEADPEIAGEEAAQAHETLVRRRIRAPGPLMQEPHGLSQPLPTRFHRLPGRLLLSTAHRLGPAQREQRGADRFDRLPGGRNPQPDLPRAYGDGPAEGRGDVPGIRQ